MIEFDIDWMPRGDHVYTITRSCATLPAKPDCAFTNAGITQYVQCEMDCSGDGCNTGIDAISEKLFVADGVQSCYTCNYTEDADGIVIGQKDCFKEVSEGGNVPSTQCPMYATASCFHAAGTHKSASDESTDFTEDFRGCSPFVEERDQYCQNYMVGEVQHQNCRETCNATDCNVSEITKKPKCYSCVASRGADGLPVGVSDDRCFEDLHDGLLADCSAEQMYCVDDMLVDWLATGEQVVKIRRGCSALPPNKDCVEGELDQIKYKDCQLACSESQCNSDLSVGDKFGSGGGSCFACKYTEKDSGDVLGNVHCGDPLSVDKDANMIIECPNYASAGCYTGASLHQFEGDVKDEVYKGCSSFVINDPGFEQYNATLSGVPYSITKSSCSGKNCNDKHYAPSDPEGGVPSKMNQCLVCDVTVDQNNKTVGIGQSACWEGDNQYLSDCKPDDVCVTELEVDWFARGHFNYRVKRGCAPSNMTAIPCYEASSTVVQVKDCMVYCSPTESGAGCNTGLDEVSNEFTTGDVSSCYQCEYLQNPDGTVQGDPTCGEEVGNTGTIKSTTCPKYADHACYQAASFHQDLSGNGNEMEDDYRGCSPFEVARNSSCDTGLFFGVEYTNCKQTCLSNNCNVDRTVKGLQCHVCSASVDSEGNQVGLGDTRCFSYSEQSPLTDCPADSKFCSTELLVDWYAKGNQVATIKRGCSRTPSPTECMTGESDRIMYKDCFEDCEALGCNTGMGVADKFGGGNQDTCYACQYIEDDDGTVSGNQNCGETPTDETPEGNLTMYKVEMNCPTWAKMGCYTGSALHNVATMDSDHGENQREENYKGCSSFDLGSEPKFYQAVLENGIQYALVKETCQGTLCNVGHTMPEEPGNGTDPTQPPSNPPSSATITIFSVVTLFLSLML